jgi:hypothetical protein
MDKFIFSNQLLFQVLGRNGLLRASVECDEYLFLIQPSDEINAHVWRGKHYLRPHLRGNRSLHSRPHFTIASILAPCFQEGRILRAAEAACAQLPASLIPVGGYGKFENGEGRSVIYIRTDSPIFHQLQCLLRGAVNAEGLRFVSAIYPNIAHLTLAKDLFRAQLNFWWPIIGSRPYQAMFHAFELVVLQREAVPYSKCEVIARIPFTGKEPLPASWGLKPQQGALF